MRRNSRISKRVTQLASRLRMQPTVIEPRVEDASYALGRSSIAVSRALDVPCEPPEGGWKGSTSARAELAVDAVGFEPTASPLQGERSTADLRAPLGGRGSALSYFKRSSQEASARRWT